MIIDAVRLPMDIERGVRGGPQFNTSVVMTDGGVVSTNQNWNYPLYKGQVGYGVQTRTNLTTVINFFWGRRGRWRGFLFRDWSDFNMSAEVLGTGNGVLVDFQVVKNYSDTVLPFTRKITRPYEPDLRVFKNGVEVSLALWSLQTGGIVRFTVAPAMGVIVTCTGTFDIPVQFATDQLDIEMELEDVGSVPQLPISEVRE